MDLRVVTIFDDAHWIVADKPSGWLTVPSRIGAADLRPCLGRHLEKMISARLFPVHRLDFEVTGICLFAKTVEAHRRSNRWFEEGLVKKHYQARSAGVWTGPFPQDFTWVSRIARGKKRSFKASHGLVSTTLARLTTKAEGELLWELWPLTGRPHQLRLELSDHGFPIVGDVLYGALVTGASDGGRPGIQLRAVDLDFSTIAESERLGLPPRLSVSSLF